MFVVYGFVLQFLETFTILSKDGNLSLSFHDRSLNSPCKTESPRLVYNVCDQQWLLGNRLRCSAANDPNQHISRLVTTFLPAP